MSDIIKKRLKIELISDLACGSGAGWGSVVDTDIVHDSYGFPYIPARRLRGLLREAISDLEDLNVVESGVSELIMGNSDSEGHHLLVGNGLLDNIERIHEEVRLLEIPKEEVFDYYTYVRNQTAIDDEGMKKAKTLRSTRVIRKGNAFYADIEYLSDDFDILYKALKMIGHMGVNRTRGFGEVKLSIENSQDKRIQVPEMKADKEYIAAILVKSLSQVHIRSDNGIGTLDYIPGKSVLGFFAAHYLKGHKVDEEFYRLFVKGNVQFLDSFITDSSKNVYYPTRMSLFKEKVKSTFIENGEEKEGIRFEDKIWQDEDHPGLKVLMKKVKNQYINYENNAIKEVKKEVVYHHRRPDDKTFGHVISNADGMGMFYQLDAISSDQYFLIRIKGNGKDLGEILRNIPEFIRIGASKNTQYGNFQVKEVFAEEFKPKQFTAGQKVVCTCLSPLLVKGNKLEGDISSETLFDFLKLDPINYFIDYTKVGGFNSKWRLQKQSYNAFRPGTCIYGTVKEGESLNSLMMMGDNIQEGCGMIIVEAFDSIPKQYFIPRQIDDSLSIDSVNTSEGLKLQKNHNRNQMYLECMEQIFKIDLNKIKLKPTQVGRVLLMLKTDNFTIFKDRVDGIKTDSFKNTVNKYINIIVGITDQYCTDQDFKENLILKLLFDLFNLKKLEGRKDG